MTTSSSRPDNPKNLKSVSHSHDIETLDNNPVKMYQEIYYYRVLLGLNIHNELCGPS